ncbi:MAG: hypothetical protein Q4G69_11360 [Planctomycetia bacterium]|nr:hypothetical protein [Planctomycetia bacterium]
MSILGIFITKKRREMDIQRYFLSRSGAADVDSIAPGVLAVPAVLVVPEVPTSLLFEAKYGPLKNPCFL